MRSPGVSQEKRNLSRFSKTRDLIKGIRYGVDGKTAKQNTRVRQLEAGKSKMLLPFFGKGHRGRARIGKGSARWKWTEPSVESWDFEGAAGLKEPQTLPEARPEAERQTDRKRNVWFLISSHNFNLPLLRLFGKTQPEASWHGSVGNNL